MFRRRLHRSVWSALTCAAWLFGFSSLAPGQIIEVAEIPLQPPVEGPALLGDADSDGEVDLSDPIAILEHLFLNGPDLADEQAADANGDGTLDAADAAYLIALIAGGIYINFDIGNLLIDEWGVYWFGCPAGLRLLHILDETGTNVLGAESPEWDVKTRGGTLKGSGKPAYLRFQVFGVPQRVSITVERTAEIPFYQRAPNVVPTYPVITTVISDRYFNVGTHTITVYHEAVYDSKKDDDFWTPRDDSTCKRLLLPRTYKIKAVGVAQCDEETLVNTKDENTFRVARPHGNAYGARYFIAGGDSRSIAQTAGQTLSLGFLGDPGYAVTYNANASAAAAARSLEDEDAIYWFAGHAHPGGHNYESFVQAVPGARFSPLIPRKSRIFTGYVPLDGDNTDVAGFDPGALRDVQLVVAVGCNTSGGALESKLLIKGVDVYVGSTDFCSVNYADALSKKMASRLRLGMNYQGAARTAVIATRRSVRALKKPAFTARAVSPAKVTDTIYPARYGCATN